jgi:regulator of RNase E activity RraA
MRDEWQKREIPTLSCNGSIRFSINPSSIMAPSSDDLLRQVRASLYVAVISDVLDSLGYMNQAMAPHIRPLDDEVTLLGYARTGLYHDVYEVKDGKNPYELEIALIDDLKPVEVPVLACGATGRIAPWGELLSTASVARGATGCVTDGLVRDIRFIRKMGFPVFHGGIGPLDSKGRGELVEMDVAIECGGVRVRSGDLMFGDADGVIAIPREVCGEVIAKALEKVSAENVTRDELAKGAKLKDIYDKYGVL